MPDSEMLDLSQLFWRFLLIKLVVSCINNWKGHKIKLEGINA